MSVRPYYDVWCDAEVSPKCPSWEDRATAPTARMARATARRYGWKPFTDPETGKRGDCCPACAVQLGLK